MKAQLIEDGRLELVGNLGEVRDLRDRLTGLLDTVEKHQVELQAAQAVRAQPVADEQHTFAVYLEKATP